MTIRSTESVTLTTAVLTGVPIPDILRKRLPQDAGRGTISNNVFVPLEQDAN